MQKDIRYTTSTEELQNLARDGFFVDWPNRPSDAQFVMSVTRASHAVLAIDDNSKRLVGYITAITDHALCAYIPFLEVLPAYQKQGIGKTLVQKMLALLGNLYMIDIVCDKEVAGFYEKAGFESWHAMIRRTPQCLEVLGS